MGLLDQIRAWLGSNQLGELAGTANLLTIGAFVLVGILVILFGLAFLRLRGDSVREQLEETVAESGRGGVSEAVVASLARQIPQFAADVPLLDRDLRRAGLYRPQARQDYLALRNMFVILAVIITALIVVLIGPERQELALQALIFGLIVAVLCWAVPRVYLRYLGNRRVERIRRGLPNALDMLTMCMTGGLSLSDALGHVSRELYGAHPDLAVEWLIVRQQADMTTMEQSLQQFARRVDTDEITAMAALIAQSQRLGTNVTTAIQEYADGIRLKWRQLADERAAKTAVHLLFPVALCLMPAVFIFMWGPAALELWNFLSTFGGPASGS